LGPLGTIPAVALCGVALYLLGHTGFRLREVGSGSDCHLLRLGFLERT